MKPLTYILIFLLVLTVSVSAYIVNAQSALYHIDQANQLDYTAYLMQHIIAQDEQIASLTAEIEQGQEIASGMVLKELGEFEVTFYCYNSGTTKSGTKPDNYTVAVNPDEIPLGSLIYVEGVGFKIASDTGGFGARTIDIYLPDYDECVKRGRVEARVWLID